MQTVMTQTTQTATTKDIEYYMALHYAIILIPEEDGWGALIPDLPGCIGAGDTIAEALEMLEDAKRGWLLVSLDLDEHVPEPKSVYTGPMYLTA